MRGYCPKCGRLTKLTKHHLYPKTFFGRGKKNSQIRFLCRECHQSVEKIIPKFQRMSKEWYLKINNQWLRGEI